MVERRIEVQSREQESKFGKREGGLFGARQFPWHPVQCCEEGEFGSPSPHSPLEQQATVVFQNSVLFLIFNDSP